MIKIDGRFILYLLVWKPKFRYKLRIADRILLASPLILGEWRWLAMVVSYFIVDVLFLLLNFVSSALTTKIKKVKKIHIWNFSDP